MNYKLLKLDEHRQTKYTFYNSKLFIQLGAAFLLRVSSWFGQQSWKGIFRKQVGIQGHEQASKVGFKVFVGGEQAISDRPSYE